MLERGPESGAIGRDDDPVRASAEGGVNFRITAETTKVTAGNSAFPIVTSDFPLTS